MSHTGEPYLRAGDMKRLATADFLNGETLESQSYRATQVAMDCRMSTSGPIAGHFLFQLYVPPVQEPQLADDEDNPH